MWLISNKWVINGGLIERGQRGGGQGGCQELPVAVYINKLHGDLINNLTDSLSGRVGNDLATIIE